MIKGLYSAFTALEAAWRYQDVLANNIANANTVGFKREHASLAPFEDVLISQQAPVPAPISARIQAVVGQIGTGTFIAEFATDFTGGILTPTGNELDLALGDGFFQVEGPGGATFYTRDGRFSRDGEGNLVTSHGYFVLDARGQRISLPPSTVSITAGGAILDGQDEVARLAVLDFAPGQLVRSGESYFRSEATGTPVNGGIRQGFLEGSNTNLVEELTSLLAVQRTYQANQAILARLDGTLDQAAGEIGRLGA